MLTESDILYEKGNYWICMSPSGGYEVYHNTITHAERVAIIGYKGEKGFERAKLECDKRYNSDIN
jgi:hypothetical protein